MADYLRPGPLLQPGRTLAISFDNGTITPLPVPQQDFWDINSAPNAGLTLVYNITNMQLYAGRVIYVTKTQNTAGATIRLTLPGGYSFSNSGTQSYDFPDDPISLILSFSSSSIVSIYGPVANPSLINYQVDDADLGNKSISAISNGVSVVDPGFATVECLASPSTVGVSITSGPQIYIASDNGIDLVSILGTPIKLNAPNITMPTLTQGVTTRDYFLSYFPVSGGPVGYRSNFFQRKGTLLNTVIPSGTANATTYGSMNIIQAMVYVIGDQLKVEYNLTNYSNLTTQSRVVLPDGSFVSIPAACDGLINITCMMKSLLASTGTWVYVIEFGNVLSQTRGSFTRGTGSAYPFSLQTEMLTTANLTLEYGIVNALRA